MNKTEALKTIKLDLKDYKTSKFIDGLDDFDNDSRMTARQMEEEIAFSSINTPSRQVILSQFEDVIVDEDPFAHIEMNESQLNNLRNTRMSYMDRASTIGTGIPSDIELHHYMISLEVLGIDETADITTIRQVFHQMVQEVRTANVGLGSTAEGT